MIRIDRRPARNFPLQDREAVESPPHELHAAERIASQQPQNSFYQRIGKNQCPVQIDAKRFERTVRKRVTVTGAADLCVKQSELLDGCHLNQSGFLSLTIFQLPEYSSAAGAVSGYLSPSKN